MTRKILAILSVTTLFFVVVSSVAFGQQLPNTTTLHDPEYYFNYDFGSSIEGMLLIKSYSGAVHVVGIDPTSIDIEEDAIYYSYWYLPRAACYEVVLEVSGSSEDICFESLAPGEVFVDTKNKVSIKAAAWAAGILYFSDGGGREIYTIQGIGYASNLPADTMWWDFAGKVWTDVASWGGISVISVPEIVPQPVKYLLYMPMISVFKPSPCLKESPFLPFYWQINSGLGVCSEIQPGILQGISPIKVESDKYNWFYPNLTNGWISVGSTFKSSKLLISADTEPIGVNEISQQPWVFSVNGLGFSMVQTDWSDVILYWDWESLSWTDKPIWGQWNVFKIE